MAENITDVLERYDLLTSRGIVAVKQDDYERVANYVNKNRGGELQLLKTALHYGVSIGYQAALNYRAELSGKSKDNN